MSHIQARTSSLGSFSECLQEGSALGMSIIFLVVSGECLLSSLVSRESPLGLNTLLFTVWSEVVFKPLVPVRLPPGLTVIPEGSFLAALSLIQSIKLLPALLFCLYPGATRLLLITLSQDRHCFQQHPEVWSSLLSAREPPQPELQNFSSLGSASPLHRTPVPPHQS